MLKLHWFDFIVSLSLLSTTSHSSSRQAVGAYRKRQKRARRLNHVECSTWLISFRDAVRQQGSRLFNGSCTFASYFVNWRRPVKSRQRSLALTSINCLLASVCFQLVAPIRDRQTAWFSWHSWQFCCLGNGSPIPVLTDLDVNKQHLLFS